MHYQPVTSSWVAKLGIAGQTIVVGTKSGKVYQVNDVSDATITSLLRANRLGGSIGQIVSPLLKNSAAMEIDEATAIQLTGAAGTAAADPQQAPTKRKFEKFIDILLPGARTGLFSFG